MKIDVKKLPKSQAEITIELTIEDAQPYLENAAKKLSSDKPIKGYRPGHATYDVVKAAYGEMAIYEEALEPIFRKFYVKAVLDNELVTYGEPKIDVNKLAPGNPISFTAVVTLIPKSLSLPELKSVKIKVKKSAVEDKEVEAALKQLQKMRTKEAAADREVRADDKVVLDMDMSLAGVPLEGGQARGHGVYLNEDYYVPGLKEQILGLKSGEVKEFNLKFPETHYQKNIAGKDVGFKVTVKQVFGLEPPALDDEFAKSLGQDDMMKLRELLRKNILAEAEDKAAQQAENEALEKLVDKSKFEDVPEAIINQEVNRMFHELEHSLHDRGLELDGYLKNLKKTTAELKLDFATQAVKRVKTALLMRDLAIREKVEVLDSELLAEQQRLINAYSDNPETQAKVRSEDYLDYLRTEIINRKVLELIRAACIDKEA
ncbi:MAG: trigger factor [Patescibacteria group bacterium]|jgi:trigger factor